MSRAHSQTSEHEQTARDICVLSLSTQKNQKDICNFSSTDSAMLVYSDVQGCDKTRYCYSIWSCLFSVSFVNVNILCNMLQLYLMCTVFVINNSQKTNLKNGKTFHPVNKRLAPIRCLPRLNAGPVRLSFK